MKRVRLIRCFAIARHTPPTCSRRQSPRSRARLIELVLAHRNSSQALALLKEGCIHVAGTHLRDEPSGESNLPAIGRLFPKNVVAVITFAVWGDVPALGEDDVRGNRRVELETRRRAENQSDIGLRCEVPALSLGNGNRPKRCPRWCGGVGCGISGEAAAAA